MTAQKLRRVRDKVSGDLGTAEHVRGSRYRVRWDSPTPHEDEVRVTIPSEFFGWADESGAPQPREGE